MTKTEYLTGHLPDRYIKQLEPLAFKRMIDMQELLEKLSEEGRDMDKTSEAYRALVKRYKEVEKAIEWWRDLLNESEEM